MIPTVSLSKVSESSDFSDVSRDVSIVAATFLWQPGATKGSVIRSVIPRMNGLQTFVEHFHPLLSFFFAVCSKHVPKRNAFRQI